MRRRLLIGLLLVGVIGGYGSAIAGVCRAHHRRAAFERHIARICADAARSPAPPPSWDDWP